MQDEFVLFLKTAAKRNSSIPAGWCVFRFLQRELSRDIFPLKPFKCYKTASSSSKCIEVYLECHHIARLEYTLSKMRNEKFLMSLWEVICPSFNESAGNAAVLESPRVHRIVVP